MFEVGGNYQNRNGDFTVLEVGPVHMKVRYTDGSEAELRISIQERIWQNILADREAQTSRKSKTKGSSKVKHFIKSIDIMSDALLNPADISALVAPTALNAPDFKSGDRFIYYSISSKSFFAVATITGDPKSAKASDYADLNFTSKKINLFPIDIDSHSDSLKHTVNLESVELESQPQFKELLKQAQSYLKISEDDFELLAEAITEFVEDDIEDEVQAEAIADIDDDSLLIDDDDLSI